MLLTDDVHDAARMATICIADAAFGKAIVKAFCEDDRVVPPVFAADPVAIGIRRTKYETVGQDVPVIARTVW